MLGAPVSLILFPIPFCLPVPIQTYDSIYPEMQSCQVELLRVFHFYGSAFCALAYILQMSQDFIITPRNKSATLWGAPTTWRPGNLANGKDAIIR
ncbi:hypothetical protein SAMN05216316_0118 [Nitrosovibrio sp. Nv6]|nr:hypothetical protein SAMN05216316_0118 [Nitrosovibrio sp. Nv6]